MFSDILSNQNNLMRMDMVKASPSVNSPNDGSFNSEENARWANKKLATKPFIVGQTEEDVAKSFGTDIRIGGYSYYTGDSLFSIDGYLFKLANTGRTSYDDEYSSVDGPGIDCAYVQKFVCDLINYGNENEIATDYQSFLFTEYVPSGTITDQFRKKWQDACSNNTVIGFIKNVYSKSYCDSFTVEGTLVSYEDNSVMCNLVQDPECPNGQTFENRSYPIGRIHRNAQDEITSIDIYYPIRIKNVRYFDYSDKTYKYEYRLYFTDIYNLDFVFETVDSMTRVYPNTENIFSSINENKPLESIGFTNCNTDTYDGSLYDFMGLYKTQSSVYIRKSLDESASVTLQNNVQLSDFFDVYTVQDLLSKMPTSVPQTDIPYIKNELEYYCFKSSDISESYWLRNSQNVAIPIAFMTSDGKICPQGFSCSDTGTQINKNYPVEGYVHFIKRMCASSTISPTPTEQDIESITLQDLYSWNGFAALYQVIYKYACLYLQVSYSSLLKNAVLNSTVEDDSKKIKVYGCGNALEGFNSSITSDDFASYQEYTFTGYNNVQNELVSTQYTVSIRHNKDISSDADKLRSETLIRNAQPLLGNYYYRSALDYSDTNAIIQYFEDPINIIKRCAGNSGYITDSVYVYTNNQLTAIPVYTSNHNIALDEFLFPCIQNLDHDTTFGPNYDIAVLMSSIGTYGPGRVLTTSLGNGVQYTFLKNAWSVYIPYAVSVKKDSLNYLSGKSYLTGMYNGLDFRFVLGGKINKDELVLLRYKGASCPKITAYGIETFNDGFNNSDEDIKTLREAYIHVSKVYDDNNQELGLIIDDIKSDIVDIKEDIGDGIESLSERISELEETVNGTLEDDGLVERVQDIETTLYNDTTGLVTQVSSIQTTLSNANMILETGSLSDPEDTDSDVRYTIYGKSLTSGNNICVISGHGNIMIFDVPWTDPQDENTVITPLINKHIESIVLLPGVAYVGEAAFSFNFNDITIPSTATIGPGSFTSNSSHIVGPKYISIAEGVRSAVGYVPSITYTPLVGVNIPKTLFTDVDTSTSLYISDNTSLVDVVCDFPILIQSMFDGCVSLKKVMLSNTYKINAKPFINCTQLKNINYQGTKAQWSNITKVTGWDVTEEEGGSATKHLEKICCYDGNLVYDSSTDTWIDEV